MPELDRTTSVEYRQIEGRLGFRFGSDSSIWTRWRMGAKGQLGDEWRPLKPSPRPNGYSWVYLGPRDETKPIRVDEVLCEAFRGPRPPGSECLHLDGDRRNNLPSNLAWGVAPENVRDPGVEYRGIDRCEGYEFGSDGSVWSYWGTGSTRPGDVIRRMNPTTLDSGHLQVAVRWDGEMRRFGVHHLICWAFHGPCPDGMECCHGDGVPDNNVPTNLRWGTPKDNVRDQIRHGVIARGERHGGARLTEEAVTAIRFLHSIGVPMNTLARRYHVSFPTIKRVVTGEAWKHVG